MNLEGLDCWDDYPMEHGCICGNGCEPPAWMTEAEGGTTMSDYTPTTADVRRVYCTTTDMIGYETFGAAERAEFDRWLAKYTAEKRAEWEAELGETEWEYEATPDWVEGIRWSGTSLDEHLSNLDRYSDPNGGWWYGGKENKPDRITYQARRRRKAGPWEPVPDTTNNESEGKA